MFLKAPQYIPVAQKRLDFFEQQVHQFKEQKKRLEADAAHIETLASANEEEMASYLLADVTDEDLHQLQTKLQYPALIQIKREFEQKLAHAQQQRQAMEQQDDVKNMDFHLSQVRDELATIGDAHADLLRQTRQWTDDPWFEELHARGFFGETYKPTFLQRFYDWRAISYLMEAMEEQLEQTFPTPDRIRDTWLALKSNAEPVFELHADLMARLRALEALQEQHTNLQEAPERIFAEMYGALSKAILRHLESCPLELRMDLARQDPFLTTFLKKQTGLSKKAQYLRELAVVRVQPHLDNLTREIAKLRGKMAKVRRKGYTSMTDEAFKKMQDLKKDKWRKRTDKVDQLGTRIRDFHKYQKGSFTDDFLWWDLFTGGARGDDLYEVRTFRRQHPSWDYRRYEEPWSSRNDDAQNMAEIVAMDMAADALADQLDQGDGWDTDFS